MNGARGIIVALFWPNGANDQAKKGDLPRKVYVKIHDPCVGLVSHFTLEGSSEKEAVQIEPVMAKFYASKK